ncbi:MAG TPA: TIGR03960 family B12-binding radical SAM protein [Armatimonadota bacterium]|jgi:radical SAM family uncharacterized protein/radical SAM-linked protein
MPFTYTSLKQRVEEDVLPRVQKPSRYLGTELNTVHKDPTGVRTRVCLAFPDMYDLGLSNLGILILYNILNARDDVWCERAYAPAPDLETLLRAETIPLFSVESKTSLKDFDLLGFTLQYELTYTNILNMLDLAAIPPLSADRTDEDPIVIAGGPCVFNPEPLADFIDAFAIGDGEDVVLDIVDATERTKGRPRAERIAALAEIDGVYVPAMYPMKTIEGGWVVPDLENAKPIQKRIVRDLNEAAFPTKYIVPFTEQAHDRVSLEVLRGCTQSCRFCQAGITTRPVRERSLEKLDTLMRDTMDSTGYEEYALSSLSTCDYSQVRALVAQSVTAAMQRGASVGLPSLRMDSFSVELSDMVRTIRQTGLTFAPEAATNRMRAVINKWIPDDALLSMTAEVFARGWDSVKLYFMIGLPTETDEDVEAIGKLANAVLKRGRSVNRRAKINLGVSTFIPKPHTPFQWDRQISVEETKHKQHILRDILGRSGPRFGHHDAQTSFLEGIFSRGDRRTGRLVYLAWKNGCRFDGWSEYLRWDLWEAAITEWGLDPDDYLAAIPLDRPLPWDHIDIYVTKQYHLDEYARSREGGLTGDCRYTKCNDCGVIHDETKACATMLKTTREGIKIERNWVRPAHLGGSIRHPAASIQEQESDAQPSTPSPQPIARGQGGAPIFPVGRASVPADSIQHPASSIQDAAEDGRHPERSEERAESKDLVSQPSAHSPRPLTHRLVITFAKRGSLRHLSHLEMARAFQRTLRRAGLPVAMSQGFHPQPKLAFATPLPTGMESNAELADVTLTEVVSPEDFVRRFNAVAVDGLEVLSAKVIEEPSGPSLMARVVAEEYEVEVNGDTPDRVSAFLAEGAHEVTRKTKNGPKAVNIRALVERLDYSDGHLTMRLKNVPGAKGRPEEILTALGIEARARKVLTVLGE